MNNLCGCWKRPKDRSQKTLRYAKTQTKFICICSKKFGILFISLFLERFIYIVMFQKALVHITGKGHFLIIYFLDLYCWEWGFYYINIYRGSLSRKNIGHPTCTYKALNKTLQIYQSSKRTKKKKYIYLYIHDQPRTRVCIYTI